MKYIVGFRYAGTVMYYVNPKGEKGAVIQKGAQKAWRFNDRRNANDVGRLMRPHGGTYFIKGVY